MKKREMAFNLYTQQVLVPPLPLASTNTDQHPTDPSSIPHYSKTLLHSSLSVDLCNREGRGRYPPLPGAGCR